VCGIYRIFYRVNEGEKKVEILTVWHGSRAEPTLQE
jgi:plasmid stabilization system protein ParE